jgi:membrane protease YdiL (CAAX protease family)
VLSLPIRAPLAATSERTPWADLRSAGVVGLGLGLVVAVRYEVMQAGAADPIAAGVAFGLALLALAGLALGRGGAPSFAASRARVAAGSSRAVLLRGVVLGVLLGVTGGAFLVALALVGRAVVGGADLPPVFRADLFPVWSIATILVATGEEAVLRGVLLDRLRRPLGLGLAILLTSVAFAVMHVPFYGWHVVPLDVGVGCWLAGLRLASRGIVAPAIAHAIADLATWWL